MINTRNFQRLLVSSLAILFVVAAPGFSQPAQTKSARANAHLLDAGVQAKIEALLARMTLEEKLGQLNQPSGSGRNDLKEEYKTLARKGLAGSFLNVVGAERTRQAQELAVKESRLGIPLLFGLDVIHGFRTTFPIPLAAASTWDAET
ncbi:MAG: glycoside hydrolase family 3 N-terminal domain-containing protein, partial [bacterium]